MSTSDWPRVKELFQATLDQPADDRPAYLERACGPDLALRQNVESLLAAYDAANGVFERAAAELSTPGPTGRVIGAYRIERELGHGGMGTVYLASRADAAFDKQVAIKIVNAALAPHDLVRRFQSERQILASLDHPNIARLLDGGTTDDGRPYFVLEYVEGQSITEYCDARALKTADRLELFRKACEAVEYIHTHRIVHRDIKPSNILVARDGVPKLLDFGIAKILESDPSSRDFAQATLPIMTPDYASPEQVRGQAVTATSDVYSLGVLLYELLTGHRPYRNGGRAATDLARAICEEQPERPSTAISRVEEVPSTTGPGLVTLTPERVSGTRDGQPDKLRRRLSGDLDTIVLMALRKEPARRYQSAGALSSDIGRHLAGLPVQARRDSVVYRGGKLVTRHPVGTLSTALGATTVGLALFSFTGAAERGEGGFAARATALVAPRHVTFASRDWMAVASFENGTGDQVFDSSLDTALAVSLGQSSYVNLFSPGSMAGSLRRMRKPTDTRVNAKVAGEIAQREGLKLVLVPAINKAGDGYVVSAVLVDPQTGSPLKSERARAGSQREVLAAVDDVSRNVRRDVGELAGSIANSAKPLVQVTTSSLDALRLFSLGQEQTRQGKFEEGKVFYERALQSDPTFTAARAALGMVEFELFDKEKGRALLADSLAGIDTLTDKEQHQIRAFYATVVERDLPKAVQYWKALITLYPDASAAHNNLGRVYLFMNRYEDASAAFKEAIRLDPYLMPAYFSLETIYLEQQGDPAAAAELSQQQLTYNDQDVWAYVHLGWANLGLGRLEEARRAFERALELRSPVMSPILGGLGATYRLLDRHADALRVFQRAQEVNKEETWAYYDAGVECLLMNDEPAAREQLDRFRRATEERLARDPKNGQYYYDLALAWTRLGNPAKGWALGQRAGALDATNDFDRARLLNLQGRGDEALDALNLAVKRGFRDFIRMRIEPDLASLAGDPRFEQLLKGLRRS
jgi:serine/threonine protein kinase/tetratricopeptide (TPR) repeat protein